MESDKPGGIMSHTIPAFRLPDDVLEREIKGMIVPGMTFKYGQTLGKDVTIEGLKSDYHALFLSPGLAAGPCRRDLLVRFRQPRIERKVPDIRRGDRAPVQFRCVCPAQVPQGLGSMGFPEG